MLTFVRILLCTINGSKVNVSCQLQLIILYGAADFRFFRVNSREFKKFHGKLHTFCTNLQVFFCRCRRQTALKGPLMDFFTNNL
jgi:hypothetical protein